MSTNFFSQWQQERRPYLYNKTLTQVRAVTESLHSLSDAELTAKIQTARHKSIAVDKKSKRGFHANPTIIEMLAVACEIISRSLKITPYDSQLLAGLAMLDGHLVEMGTGEGKTIAAIFPAFIRSLSGSQTHIITSNEYLANRDAALLYPVYKRLGLTVSVIRSTQDINEKRIAYSCDIVYGVQSEFGLDYLRDNIARIPKEIAQVRGREYAILDEADFVLLDSARSPLALFSASVDNPEVYEKINHLSQQLMLSKQAPETFDGGGVRIVKKIMKKLRSESMIQAQEGVPAPTEKKLDSEEEKGHFTLDHEKKMASLTEAGYERATELLILYGLISKDQANYSNLHNLLLQKICFSLASHHLLHRDRHYIIEDKKLILIDALTGRLNRGKTFDIGFMQALQAKESIPISPDRDTLASISVQAYMSRYSGGFTGMSGTLKTEEPELLEMYGKRVKVIPPNKPSKRKDYPDKIFQTHSEKMTAILADITQRNQSGQPIIIGADSEEQAQKISYLLNAAELPNEVLTAKNHSKEASIFALAGRKGAITVTTSLAGRGVDIELGGSFKHLLRDAQEKLGQEKWDQLSAQEQFDFVQEVKKEQADNREQVLQAGGLHVIGLERYETRRMDNQLRGRAGRQGDPGSSQFYVSFDDPRIEDFAGDKLRRISASLGITAGDDLESALIAKTIDSIQRKIEQSYVSARKSAFEYDEILDAQCRAFYEERSSILNAEPEDLLMFFNAYVKEVAQELAQRYIKLCSGSGEFVPDKDLLSEISIHGIRLDNESNILILDEEAFIEWIKHEAVAQFEQRQQQLDTLPARVLALRYAYLTTIDLLWFEHRNAMELMRRGIHLRGHAKEDPKIAYRREAYRLFEKMLHEARYMQFYALLNWEIAGLASAVGVKTDH